MSWKRKSNHVSSVTVFSSSAWGLTNQDSAISLLYGNHYSLRIQSPLIRSRYYVVAGANERRLYSQAIFTTVRQIIINALSNTPFHPHTWWRYLDDIFMIWTEGLDPTIKVTSNHSLTNVPFLDVIVSLHNVTIETDLYTKPRQTPTPT